MLKRTKILYLTVFLIILIVSNLAYAEQAPLSQAAKGQPGAKLADPREIEAFCDSYLKDKMSANHISGAVVSVVKDGKVVFAKGYGYADVSKKTPIDPQKTVFRIGSLSKLFTWTAVMQLAEEGKLDLNADVNQYLDFKIPATYSQPITLNHLMAHNAGFEIINNGQFAAAFEQKVPLDKWLKDHLPARVRPVGQFSGYGNYSAGLAGYIVERVSGMPYDDYIDKNILIPLGMTHTTSRQPLPASIAKDLAQGYFVVNGQYQPYSVEVINPEPAGSFSSNAMDIARFMMAHLNNGRYDDTSILQPATAQNMHSRSFSHDPRLNGWAHGFMEMDTNGQRIIGHPGMTFVFRNMLSLFPEHNLGLFIGMNSSGGDTIIFDFPQSFVKHFFPKDLPVLTPPANFTEQAKRFTGSYRMTHTVSYTTPEKLLSLVQCLNFTADKDGLVLYTPYFGEEHFIEVEPLVFRKVNSDSLLIFREDKQGNITNGFYSQIPMFALEKLQWYENPMLHLALLAFCILLFLSFLTIGPIAYLVRKKRNPNYTTTTLGRFAQITAGLSSILALGLLFIIVASIFNFMALCGGNVPLWKFVPAGSIVFTVLAFGMFEFMVMAWKKHLWSLAGRIQYTLGTLAAVAFVWFMYFWNILGKSL